MSDARATVGRMKTMFSVRTDADLAEQLSVSRSTVTGWKCRGSVPRRYVKMAEQMAQIAEQVSHDPVDEAYIAVAHDALSRGIAQIEPLRGHFPEAGENLDLALRALDAVRGRLK